MVNAKPNEDLMRVLGMLVAGVVLCTACGTDPTPESRDLDALRHAMASYTDTTVAKLAGWTDVLTPCMVAPDSSGAMGTHYGKDALIGDGGVLDVEHPEVLIWEPKNGVRTLVGAEYVVPYAAHSRDSTPPVLFGQEFTRFDDFQLWGLHVWAWRTNPLGLYAPWNPNVHCPDQIGHAMAGM